MSFFERWTRNRVIVGAAALSLMVAACGTSGEGGADTTPTAADTTLATDPPTETTGATDTTQAPQGPIKIGVLNPQTGNFTIFGEQSNAGIQLYFDSIGGEIAGRTVELLYADTAGDPQQGLEQARRLVEEEEVDALVGLVSSGVVVALKDFADQSEVPLVITVGSAASVTLPENASQWVNRVSVASGQEELPLGWYAATQLGYTTASTVTWDFLAGDERAAAFGATFAANGGSIVSEQKPPPNATEYGPFLSALDPETTEAMYVFAAGPGSIAFFQQRQDFGLQQIAPLGSGFVTAGILEALGETALGLVQGAQYVPVIDNDLNKEFLTGYIAATSQEPGVYSAQGFLGALTLGIAIEALDGDVSDKAALASTIRGLSFDSPAGPISFDENGQVIRNIYITEVISTDDGGVTHKIVDVIEGVDQAWQPPS